MDRDAAIALWRKVLRGPTRCWVLFEHGTCVALAEPGDDPEAEAFRTLTAVGQSRAGEPTADFALIEIPKKDAGWIVTCRDPAVLVHIPREDVGKRGNEVTVGLLGRSRRLKDAEVPRVVHVEWREPDGGDGA